jgi:hypothetical protein
MDVLKAKSNYVGMDKLNFKDTLNTEDIVFKSVK